MCESHPKFQAFPDSSHWIQNPECMTFGQCRQTFGKFGVSNHSTTTLNNTTIVRVKDVSVMIGQLLRSRLKFPLTWIHYSYILRSTYRLCKYLGSLWLCVLISLWLLRFDCFSSSAREIGKRLEGFHRGFCNPKIQHNHLCDSQVQFRRISRYICPELHNSPISCSVSERKSFLRISLKNFCKISFRIVLYGFEGLLEIIPRRFVGKFESSYVRNKGQDRFFQSNF